MEKHTVVLPFKTRINLPLDGKQLLIDDMSFQKILFQYRVCPLTKSGGMDAVYPVANRKNHIQIIGFCGVQLFSVITHVFQSGICATSFYFT